MGPSPRRPARLLVDPARPRRRSARRVRGPGGTRPAPGQPRAGPQPAHTPAGGLDQPGGPGRLLGLAARKGRGAGAVPVAVPGRVPARDRCVHCPPARRACRRHGQQGGVPRDDSGSRPRHRGPPGGLPEGIRGRLGSVDGHQSRHRGLLEAVRRLLPDRPRGATAEDGLVHRSAVDL